eukprot:TRINITY_DN521_c0_g1_i2.p1 TRINITY_DN521_c0_g1~~TRINITY_DN521_c0_g1_i2.p1  ORF type:complete len:715 (-),score=147.74 TRINITY_DN521_c0_g1_i2:29-2122(-)
MAEDERAKKEEERLMRSLNRASSRPPQPTFSNRQSVNFGSSSSTSSTTASNRQSFISPQKDLGNTTSPTNSSPSDANVPVARKTWAEKQKEQEQKRAEEEKKKQEYLQRQKQEILSRRTSGVFQPVSSGGTTSSPVKTTPSPSTPEPKSEAAAKEEERILRTMSRGSAIFAVSPAETKAASSPAKPPPSHAAAEPKPAPVAESKPAPAPTPAEIKPSSQRNSLEMRPAPPLPERDHDHHEHHEKHAPANHSHHNESVTHSHQHETANHSHHNEPIKAREARAESISADIDGALSQLDELSVTLTEQVKTMDQPEAVALPPPITELPPPIIERTEEQQHDLDNALNELDRLEFAITSPSTSSHVEERHELLAPASHINHHESATHSHNYEPATHSHNYEPVTQSHNHESAAHGHHEPAKNGHASHVVKSVSDADKAVQTLSGLTSRLNSFSPRSVPDVSADFDAISRDVSSLAKNLVASIDHQPFSAADFANDVSEIVDRCVRVASVLVGEPFGYHQEAQKLGSSASKFNDTAIEFLRKGDECGFRISGSHAAIQARQNCLISMSELIKEIQGCFHLTLPKCHKCGKEIEGAYMKADGIPYHRECFSCGVCGKALTSYFTMDNQLYCEDDYRQRMVETGKLTSCSRCSKVIDGQYVNIEGKSFHTNCFSCVKCGTGIVGKFFEVEGEVLCNMCYISPL